MNKCPHCGMKITKNCGHVMKDGKPYHSFIEEVVKRELKIGKWKKKMKKSSCSGQL